MASKLHTEPRAAGEAAHPGLTPALCCLSFFRRRHRWKEKGTRKGLLRNVRIKDWSHYGTYVAEARRLIRQARSLGWRGSIVSACARGDHLRLAKEGV